MNRARDAGQAQRLGVPRMRGDEPVEITPRETDTLCSPHARG